MPLNMAAVGKLIPTSQQVSSPGRLKHCQNQLGPLDPMNFEDAQREEECQEVHQESPVGTLVSRLTLKFSFLKLSKFHRL